jgi:hypothetical protein
MAVDDFGDHVSHVGLRIDAIEFAGFDERRDDRPVLAAAVGAGVTLRLIARIRRFGVSAVAATPSNGR